MDFIEFKEKVQNVPKKAKLVILPKEEVQELIKMYEDAQYWRERHSKDNEALGIQNHELWTKCNAE